MRRRITRCCPNRRPAASAPRERKLHAEAHLQGVSIRRGAVVDHSPRVIADPAHIRAGRAGLEGNVKPRQTPGPGGQLLEVTWKKLLVNQFHDILPGSSIGKVYEKAVRELCEVKAAAEEGTAALLQSLAEKDDDAVTVFNPASHSLPRFVALDAAFACGAVDEEGHRWPAMPTEGGSLVQLSVPPLGASVLRPASVAADESAHAAARAEVLVLENSRLRALFSAEGELVSLVTLSDGRERVRSASNRFHLYRDLPHRYDAWDIDSQTEDREVFPETACEAEVAESSGLRASLRFTRRFSHSMPSQTVSLAAGDTELLFDTRAE